MARPPAIAGGGVKGSADRGMPPRVSGARKDRPPVALSPAVVVDGSAAAAGRSGARPRERLATTGAARATPASTTIPAAARSSRLLLGRDGGGAPSGSEDSLVGPGSASSGAHGRPGSATDPGGLDCSVGGRLRGGGSVGAGSVTDSMGATVPEQDGHCDAPTGAGAPQREHNPDSILPRHPPGMLDTSWSFRQEYSRCPGRSPEVSWQFRVGRHAANPGSNRPR
jgi:hypothetical protein